MQMCRHKIKKKIMCKSEAIGLIKLFFLLCVVARNTATIKRGSHLKCLLCERSALANNNKNKKKTDKIIFLNK